MEMRQVWVLRFLLTVRAALKFAILAQGLVLLCGMTILHILQRCVKKRHHRLLLFRQQPQAYSLRPQQQVLLLHQAQSR